MPNIDHYEFMAQASQEEGETTRAKRYFLMARIYRALIEKMIIYSLIAVRTSSKDNAHP